MDQGLLGFVTLLIGLATGPQTVELLVSRPVAEVRLILDDREVAALKQPPWRARVDLGAWPAPHRLEAAGLDAAGKEVARVAQWVNLPNPEVALDVVLDRGASGRVETARLAWESARPDAVPQVRATLDGRALAVTGAERVSLPRLDLSLPHFLRVEAEFPDGQLASREIGFGGGYSDTGISGLTAIATAVVSGHGSVRPGEVSAVLAGGGHLGVAAVEEGSARLVVVVDRRAVGLRSAGSGAAPRRPPRAGADDAFLLDPRPLHFSRGSTRSTLFTAARCPHVNIGDLARVLRPELEGVGAPAGQILSNAVASAGLIAATGGHPRAVLLIVGAATGGGGDMDVAGVRDFLRRLGVPLLVWSLSSAAAARPSGEWGAAVDVSSPGDLERASERLDDELRRQRIVWVEGLHLPQDVVLSSARLARLD